MCPTLQFRIVLNYDTDVQLQAKCSSIAASTRPMSTTRIDIDKELGNKARVIAKTEHRSLTAHVNLLIEEDIRKRQRKTRTA